MREQELRRLVREVVARQLQVATPRSGGGAGALGHPSHARFGALDGDDVSERARCVIEPAVLCTGCGYCKSYGH